MSDVFLYVKNL